MKVLIFGATGGTGAKLISEALLAGHTVTAFARDPTKVEGKHQIFAVLRGDVLNLKQVQQAMKGQDVVLCALGFGKQVRSKSLVHSLGTENIIKAMHENNVKRIICETAVLVGDGTAGMNLIGKFYLRIMSLIAPHFLKEKDKQENLIRDSRLEWVIARPVALTDGEKTGVYQAGPKLKNGFSSKISRADVAHFMVNQITSNQFLYKTPTLKY